MLLLLNSVVTDASPSEHANMRIGDLTRDFGYPMISGIILEDHFFPSTTSIALPLFDVSLL
jgi:hypothetical protein